MLSEADLLRRQRFITSSDAAPILGLDKFGTGPIEVYWRKHSPLAAKQEFRKEWDLGHRLEDVLCEWGANRLGGVPFERQQWVESIDGITAATLDGLITDRPEALEAKYAGGVRGDDMEWGDEGTDQIPQAYIVQTQHDCHVANLTRVWVPALIIGYRAEFRLYCVERNDELIDAIVRAEWRFFRDHIETQVPPDRNPVPPADVLKAMRRQTGKSIELTAVAPIAWDWLETARGACTEMEHRKKEIEAVVLAQLGDAEVGGMPDGRSLRYVEEGAGFSTDTTLLRALAPEVYERVVTPRTRRVLRVKYPAKKRGA